MQAYGENFDFFLFLSYFYTFSFKNRLPSPAIGIIICSDLCISLLSSFLSLTRDIRDKYERIRYFFHLCLGCELLVSRSSVCDEVLLSHY